MEKVKDQAGITPKNHPNQALVITVNRHPPVMKKKKAAFSVLGFMCVL